MINPLSLEEIKHIAFSLAEKTMSWNEPIPPFETRFPNVLESCISTPFQRFEGRNLYSGLAAKAGILFYLLIKNHPFQNGNKRMAVTSLLIFLLKNKRWVNVDNKELYNLAVWTAQSPAAAKDDLISYISSFIQKRLKNNPSLKRR